MPAPSQQAHLGSEVAEWMHLGPESEACTDPRPHEGGSPALDLWRGQEVCPSRVCQPVERIGKGIWPQSLLEQHRRPLDTDLGAETKSAQLLPCGIFILASAVPSVCSPLASLCLPLTCNLLGLQLLQPCLASLYIFSHRPGLQLWSYLT